MSDEVRRALKIIARAREMHQSHPPLIEAMLEEASSDSPPPFEATLISNPSAPTAVYVGSVSDAMYSGALKERQIGGIINVANSQLLQIQRLEKAMASQDPDGVESQWEIVQFDKGWYEKEAGNRHFQYLAIDAEDHPKYDMSPHFEECIDFIKNNCAQTASVLIHCVQGRNRSASIAVAYLVMVEGMTVFQAIEKVAESRRNVLSNRAFVRQLVEQFSPSPKELRPRPPTPPRIFSIGEVVERPSIPS